MNLRYILFASLAFAITYIITPFIMRVALEIGAFDHPEERRVNKTSVPNIGGLAIFVGFITAFVFSEELSREMLGIILGGTLMLIMGFVDSIVGLKALPKLISQVIGALVLISFGVKIDILSNPIDGVYALGDLSVPLTIIWVVGMTNVINFIDGLDGLAAGIVSISSGVLAVIAFLTGRPEILPMAMYLGASSLAFLRYNYHPAQIFMGDAGSQFLGFVLAGMAILGTLKSAAFISLLIPILAVGVPIIDTALVVLKRAKNKQKVYLADREHLHHLFLGQGYDQKKAVLMMYALNLILGVVAIISTQVTKTQSIFLFVLAVLFMISIRNVTFKTKKEIKK
ncbi:MAG: Glycosyl transferase, family 4, conserved region [candidate division CPR2 bacterium GW2011_GWC1_41_48]|uniref:Glycosyl transferase, family 4, conserved region n=1 Tax=candidate division CPR2 bacterium GW2011_GWC1_41_48 TaxID=1618344 RepID=A0A0G0W8X1_UNCC2|nr:MAG: Glycosyl transferase, family 4, conserved region [candidate division CPR2 bacterium GW2011_GWC2_39_35]KKR27971.1 MAG: Glycosyl transferase, family 4, conserved region [candidate division CPR2 bacterium GW2011_GWD2_39_7]KKS09430.1 MAG: Glycosyl transferase, family 4, conserved region [candidate division CPR2 bacterium GW2011_GWC1_41_48]OGB72079.1 MAG: hypothetical protein A2Y26_01965 [candidate division CPR2 bacterium GWD2_39_7]